MKYPEHEKLDTEKFKIIQSFCWHLESANVLFEERELENEDLYYKSLNSSQVQSLILEYFDVNEKEFFAEKDRMLDELREAQG